MKRCSPSNVRSRPVGWRFRCWASFRSERRSSTGLLSGHVLEGLTGRGETEQRIYNLDAWRETPYYNARERAALAWTGAVTDLRAGHVSDMVYEEVRQEFTEDEVTLFAAAIAAINSVFPWPGSWSRRTAQESLFTSGSFLLR